MTPLSVGVATHVSLFKNTERFNWKSRASTTCSYYGQYLLYNNFYDMHDRTRFLTSSLFK